MKAFIVALALLVAPTVAPAKPSEEQCLQQAAVVFFAAQGRDIGSEPTDIFNGLIKSGYSPQAAFAIIKYVFVSADTAPDELATKFLNYCISEAV